MKNNTKSLSTLSLSHAILMTMQHLENLSKKIQNKVHHEGVTKLILKAIDELNPKRIVLFGSRAKGTARSKSDFDIAIFPINPNEEKWTAFVLEAQESPEVLFPVDWVNTRKASKEILASIKKEGIILYEKKRKLRKSSKKA